MFKVDWVNKDDPSEKRLIVSEELLADFSSELIPIDEVIQVNNDNRLL